MFEDQDILAAEALKEGLDFQTPIPVAKYMVSMIPPGTRTVLEPTPGQGNIVSLLTDYQVTAPECFFLLPEQRFDCVVMNPPFSAKYARLENAQADYKKHGMRLGYDILLQCTKMSDHVIALMPTFTLIDSDKRVRHIFRYGLRSVTILPRKTFQYSRIQCCVMEFEKGFKGTTAMYLYDLLNKQEIPQLF